VVQSTTEFAKALPKPSMATQWSNQQLSLPKPCQSLAKALPKPSMATQWFNQQLNVPKPCQSLAKALPKPPTKALPNHTKALPYLRQSSHFEVSRFPAPSTLAECLDRYRPSL
jgi:hypothetical protein